MEVGFCCEVVAAEVLWRMLVMVVWGVRIERFTSKERIVTMVDIRRPLSTLSMLARRSCMIFMVSPRW